MCCCVAREGGRRMIWPCEFGGCRDEGVGLIVAMLAIEARLGIG